MSRETFIHPTAIIDPCVTVGKGCYIDAGVLIGFQGLIAAKDSKGKIIRNLSTGSVSIGDNVWIGAGTVIEKGHEGVTIIEDGVHIDVDCMIAHECHIGKHTVIVAGTLIAGFTVVKEHSHLALGCVITNRITIGKKVFVGMGSVVTKDIQDGMTVVGSPAIEINRFRARQRYLNSVSKVPLKQKITSYTKRMLGKIPFVRRIKQKSKR